MYTHNLFHVSSVIVVPFFSFINVSLIILHAGLSETLQAQIQALNYIKLNAVQTNSKNIYETNVWDAQGLLQQKSTEITSGSGSPMNNQHQ